MIRYKMIVIQSPMHYKLPRQVAVQIFVERAGEGKGYAETAPVFARNGDGPPGPVILYSIHVEPRDSHRHHHHHLQRPQAKMDMSANSDHTPTQLLYSNSDSYSRH